LVSRRSALIVIRQAAPTRSAAVPNLLIDLPVLVAQVPQPPFRACN
jgi:hypothetical protein